MLVLLIIHNLSYLAEFKIYLFLCMIHLVQNTLHNLAMYVGSNSVENRYVYAYYHYE